MIILDKELQIEIEEETKKAKGEILEKSFQEFKKFKLYNKIKELPDL